MNNFNINQEVENKINACNQRLSSVSAAFFNTFEDLKQLMNSDDRAEVERNLAAMDTRLSELLKVCRPFIRKYVQANIRTLLAQDKMGAKNHD